MLIFVYGTLKQGWGNHRLLQDEGVKFVGVGVTDANFRLVGRGFPYMIPSEDGKPVVGEVYEVDNEQVMQNLDWLEGVPNHYHRAYITVNEGVEVMTYIPTNPPVNWPECPTDIHGRYVWLGSMRFANVG